MPSTRVKYDPIAQHTRSRVTYIVEPPPPRVYKATYPRPISWCTRSHTTSKANVITQTQAAKRQYSAQFLQILAMPVLDETSRQLLGYRQLRKHPKFKRQWTGLTIPRRLKCIKGPQEPTRWGHKDFPHHPIWIYPSWQTKRNMPLHGCVWSMASKGRSQLYTHHNLWRPHLLSRRHRHTHRFPRHGQAHY